MKSVKINLGVSSKFIRFPLSFPIWAGRRPATMANELILGKLARDQSLYLLLLLLMKMLTKISSSRANESLLMNPKKHQTVDESRTDEQYRCVMMMISSKERAKN